MPEASLKGTLSFDDKPFVEGMSKSLDHAKTFGEKLKQLFSREPVPERRGAKAFASITEGLVGSGTAAQNAGQAISGFARTLSLGLRGGAIAGSIVSAFTAVAEESEKAKETFHELQRESRANIHRASFMGASEGADALGASYAKLRKELRQYSDEERKYSFSKHPLRSILREAGGLIGIGQNAPGEAQKGIRARELALQLQQVQQATKRTEAFKEAASIAKSALTSDQQEVEISKLMLNYDRERRQLVRERAGDEALKALQTQYGAQVKLLRIEQERQRLQLDLGLRTAMRANIGAGQTPAQQAGYNIRERMENIDKELRGPTAPARATALQTERQQLTNQLEESQLEEFHKSPAERLAEKIAISRRLQDVKTIRANQGMTNVRKDISGNVVGGEDLMTGDTIDRGFQSQLGELGKHMAGGGHMDPFAGSDSFNSFFHPAAMQAQPRGASGGDEEKTDLGDLEGLLKDLSGKMDKYWGG